MRQWETGANRDDDTDKMDYEGFLSPVVLERFAQYMHAHRHLEDGSVRSAGNWQRGIPLEAYRSSLIRHVMQAWKLWRGFPVAEKGKPVDLEDALCAILFNTQGMLLEVMKERA